MFTQCPSCQKVFTISVEQLRKERAIMNCPDCDIKFDALELLCEKRPYIKQGRYKKIVPANGEANQTTVDASLLQEMLQGQKKKNAFPLHQQKMVSQGKKTVINETDRKAPTFEATTYFARESELLKRHREPTHSPSRTWGAALLSVIALLIVQIYYFENAQLLQNKKVRPTLETACQLFNCQLPLYKNIAELSIMHGSFKPISKKNYQLQAVFSNNSSFAQSFPAIKLALLKFNGDILASRTFHPEEYLMDNPGKAVIPGNEMVEVSMDIVPPEAKIGGYTLELL